MLNLSQYNLNIIQLKLCYSGPMPPKSKPTVQSHHKKELILKTALQLAGTQDFTLLNLKEISQRSGVSKSLILYHYPNLKSLWLELFLKLIHAAQEQTAKEIETENDPVKRIFKIASAAVAWIKKEPLHGKFFFLMYHQASVDKDFRLLHRQVLSRGLERIELCLFQSGKFQDPEQVKFLAFSIHNLIIGTMIRAVSLDEISKISEYEARLFESIERLIGV